MSEPLPDVSVWRSRDFRLIWSAQSLSDLGSGLSQLAYPLLMLALTGSPAQAGALGAVRALPYLLLGLPAGALTDRWNRRRVMIICDGVRAVMMLSVPVAVWAGRMSVVQLYVVAVISGSAYVFFSAAETGALPNVVAPQQLSAAVSAQEISSSTTAVVAAPIGGVLFGIFRGFPFLVDAASFAVSAWALSAVRARFSSPKLSVPNREAHLAAEVLGGVRWLFGHPVLGRVAVAAGLLQVAISGVGLVVILDVRDRGGSTALVGVVLSAVGIGGVLGALAANRVKQHLGFARTLQGIAALQAVFWLMLATSPSLWLTAATLVLFAGTMPIFGVAVLSYQMHETPDSLRGRVGTAFGLLTWGATPVGAAGAGVLLAHFSVTVTALLFAAWTAAVAALCVVLIRNPGPSTTDTGNQAPRPK